MAHKRMKFPAPRGCSVEVRGKWFTRPWTVEDVKEYITVGGWFFPGKHDFADLEAAKIAGAGSV